MVVYDSDSSHVCSSKFASSDSHVDRHKNVIQYEIKALCPHALGT